RAQTQPGKQQEKNYFIVSRHFFSYFRTNFKTLCGAEKRSPRPACPTFLALPLRVKPLNAGRRRPPAIIFSSSANTFFD
ncbi:MAG: hypothetical protein AB7F32_13305, partial [Victivallaceae bacterium]